MNFLLQFLVDIPNSQLSITRLYLCSIVWTRNIFPSHSQGKTFRSYKWLYNFSFIFVYLEMLLKCFNSYLFLNKIGIILCQYRVYQAFSVPLLTAQIQLQTRCNTRNICTLSSTEAGFSPNTSFIPCHLYCTNVLLMQLY